MGKWLKYSVGIILVILAIAMLVFASFSLHKVSFLSACGHKSISVVVDRRNSGINTFLFSVNDEVVRFTPNYNTDYKINENVTILYDPNDPSYAIVDTFSVKWLPIIMSLIMAIVFLMPLSSRVRKILVNNILKG